LTLVCCVEHEQLAAQDVSRVSTFGGIILYDGDDERVPQRDVAGGAAIGKRSRRIPGAFA